MCLHLEFIHRMPQHFKYAINKSVNLPNIFVYFFTFSFRSFILILSATGPVLPIVLQNISNLKSTIWMQKSIETERDSRTWNRWYPILIYHFVFTFRNNRHIRLDKTFLFVYSLWNFSQKWWLYSLFVGCDCVASWIMCFCR